MSEKWIGLNTSHDWPALPTSGFICGRAATLDGAQDGNAVFVQQVRHDDVDTDECAKPVLIDIPQLAVFCEDGSKRKVVIVQAEYALGSDQEAIIFGLRDKTGSEYVATQEEVELDPLRFSNDQLRSLLTSPRPFAGA